MSDFDSYYEKWRYEAREYELALEKAKEKAEKVKRRIREALGEVAGLTTVVALEMLSNELLQKPLEEPKEDTRYLMQIAKEFIRRNYDLIAGYSKKAHTHEPFIEWDDKLMDTYKVLLDDLDMSKEDIVRYADKHIKQIFLDLTAYIRQNHQTHISILIPALLMTLYALLKENKDELEYYKGEIQYLLRRFTSMLEKA